jgi:class 3 adenylate cyclase
MRWAALEGRIEADLALGRQAVLVAELEALVAEEPLRERLAGQLMVALYRCGRQADALGVYRRTRQVLGDQLGIDPSPDMRALELAVLQQSLHLAAPPVVSQSAYSVPAPPTGTVTFLFSDIEGSTRRLGQAGNEQYASELMDHRGLIREVIAANQGFEVGTEGDAFFVAFGRAFDALGAAEAIQKGLAGSALQVRIGVHTGEPLLIDGDYVGLDVHRAARICSAAHGGQVLVSQATRDLSDADLRDLGEFRLKDLAAPERLFQLGGDRFPPPGAGAREPARCSPARCWAGTRSSLTCSGSPAKAG